LLLVLLVSDTLNLYNVPVTFCNPTRWCEYHVVQPGQHARGRAHAEMARDAVYAHRRHHRHVSGRRDTARGRHVPRVRSAGRHQAVTEQHVSQSQPMTFLAFYM